MLTRRGFLSAAASCLAYPAFAEEQPPKKESDINSTLEKIADLLRAEPFGATVDTHLVRGATHRFTQWRWAHFNHNIRDRDIPIVERVNAELLPAILAVQKVPGAGLDALMHEGFIEDKVEERMGEYRTILKELMGTGADKEMRDIAMLHKPIHQIVYPTKAFIRRICISPVTRLGAGYAASLVTPLTILAAEDPVIDEKAAIAEWSNDPEEFEEWVMRRRNEHFIKLVRESRRQINHLLVGYDHDLTGAITTSNRDYPQQISRIVVSVKGVVEAGK